MTRRLAGCALRGAHGLPVQAHPPPSGSQGTRHSFLKVPLHICFPMADGRGRPGRPSSSWNKAPKTQLKTKATPEILNAGSWATHGNHLHLLLDKFAHKAQRNMSLGDNGLLFQKVKTQMHTLRKAAAFPWLLTGVCCAVSFHLPSKRSGRHSPNFALGTHSRMAF